ncbi:biorientation of chromosomes in cell division protein 1-like 1 isoform X2 [Cimex lectularius]|uniref:BOD1/SHG1 domain-containing protein n=1 Tax=Cimex lectularius TaxID=79782 RepID=A0A8I6RHI6_CIMLE|nr:biorientation of chromosomes in cell division protein 1-like 1 isoform X2 [Cimex lectularius]
MAFDSFQHQAQFPAVDHVDNELVDKIVNKLKSQGIFDQFRKDCLADVDTKPAYQHLQQRVNGSVSGFLKKNQWKQDLNKTQLRESLRHHVQQGFLQAGVDRIVDQVVNSKIYSVFMPKVEDMVYETLGIEKPKRPERVKPIGTSLAPKVESPVNTPQKEKPAETTPTEQQPKSSQSPMSLLPKGLDPISPPSDIEDVDRDDSNTIDETPFLLASLKQKEAAPPQHSEVSNGSKLSGISELSSHGSRIEISSTTNSIVPKTPTKSTSNQKLDNFSNLSEKLKQFDPLNKTIKNTLSDSKKANDSRCSEEEVSSTSATLPVESESNGYNRDDSNAELERQLMSEDSKSSLTDFKKFKSHKADLKSDNANKTEEDSSVNDSNLESKKSRSEKSKKSDSSKDKDLKKKSDRKESSSSKEKDKKRTERKDSEKKDSSKSSRHSSSKSHDSKRSDDSKHRSDKKDEKSSSSRDKSKDDKYRLKDDKHKSEKKPESEKKDHKKEDDKESKEKRESDKTKSSKDSKKSERHHKSSTSDKDKAKHKTSDKKSDEKHKEEDNKKDKDDDRKKREEEKKKDKSKKEDAKDKNKEKEKLSRKRKGERCSEVKSKESRRSSDRDNSGSGHSSKKPSSHSSHKSSSEKTSSSKHKEHGQNGNGPQDADEGLSEVDLILMKINSSIEEEEIAMAPLKKTKFAKNAHEVKKIINAKRHLERQKRNSLLDSTPNEESPIDNKENLQDHIAHQNIKEKEETQRNEIKLFVPENEIKSEDTVDKNIQDLCAFKPEQEQEDIQTVETEFLTEDNVPEQNRKEDCTENESELTDNQTQNTVCNETNDYSDIKACIPEESQKEEETNDLNVSTSVTEAAKSPEVEKTKSVLISDNEMDGSSCNIANNSESENQPSFLGFDSECIAVAKQQLVILNNLIEKMRSLETQALSSDDELDNNLNNLRSSRLRKRKSCDATHKVQRNIRKSVKGNNGCVSLRTSDDNDCPENCISPRSKSPDNSPTKPLSYSLTEAMLNNLLKESNISTFQNREDDEEDVIPSKTVVKSTRNVKSTKIDKTEKKEKCTPDGKTLSPALHDKRRKPKRSSARFY